MKLEHMQDLIQVARPIPYVCFCGVYGGMVIIIRKHKHEENVGTFGRGLSVLEPFECVSSYLGSYGNVWQTWEAWQHNPICM